VVPPLITMLNAEPEIQFVALQEIRELIARWSVPFISSYKVSEISMVVAVVMCCLGVLLQI
jgi:hypothetical protein